MLPKPMQDRLGEKAEVVAEYLLSSEVHSTQASNRLLAEHNVYIPARTIRRWRGMVTPESPSKALSPSNVTDVPNISKRSSEGFTEASSVVSGETEVELAASDMGDVPAETLRRSGLDPDDWLLKGVRTSEWTMASGELGQSLRYSFERNKVLGSLDTEPIRVEYNGPKLQTPVNDGALLLALGDTQFGKIENGEPRSHLALVLDIFANAVRSQYAGQSEVVVAFLGDHIEGFNSQGGANTFRTPLSLTEQIRLTRSLMTGAMEILRFLLPTSVRVKFVGVPGNHDEAHRVLGSGVTIYGDSHDIDALIATADLAEAKGYDHMTFHVPMNDTLTVAIRAGETNFMFAHGHKARIGKALDWWRAQAFNDDTASEADVLVSGHYHHLQMESDGDRLWMQVPALELGSYIKHSAGYANTPGMIAATFYDGRMTNFTQVHRKGEQ